MKLPTNFTIRVYGLLINQNKLLLSRENIRGKLYLKFPGGGLEFGEGTLDCLHREFREELDISIITKQHFYTTEPYFQSEFGEAFQVMSIYYFVETNELDKINLSHPTEVEKLQNHEDQLVYWQDVSTLHPQDFELPIDRIVVEKLIKDLPAEGIAEY